MLCRVSSDALRRVLAIEDEFRLVPGDVAVVEFRKIDQCLAEIVRVEHDASQLRTWIDIGEARSHFGARSNKAGDPFNRNNDFTGLSERTVERALGDGAQVPV